MITDITLENFKGFRQVEILPKQITAFVGPNGTGKSSVLQAFGLLKQTVGKAENSPEADGEPLNWELEIATQGPLVYVPSVRALRSNSKRVIPSLTFGGRFGPSPRLESPLSYSVRFSSVMRIRSTQLPRSALSGVGRVTNALKMVLAVRALEQPVYGLEEDLVEDIFLIEGAGHQESQAATNLVYSSTKSEKISALLKKVTGTGLRAEIVPSKSVEVKSLNKAGSFNIVAEGFGTNSLIMLLLQLVSAERGATVMIEEPEIHLHPKAQAELASVLVEEALSGDKQVIMTTHSETILNRLLTLVVEGTLPLDDLAIYAFEKDEETGVCSAKPLKIDAGGRVEGGIKDFYAVNLAEMNRYVEAQFARMQASQ